jgi:hypothetical protein
MSAAWVIDYKLRFFAATPTLMKRAHKKDVPIPVQEMRDVKQRLCYMDELGIDKQVVFHSMAGMPRGKRRAGSGAGAQLQQIHGRSVRAVRRPALVRRGRDLSAPGSGGAGDPAG